MTQLFAVHHLYFHCYVRSTFTVALPILISKNIFHVRINEKFYVLFYNLVKSIRILLDKLTRIIVRNKS